MKRRQLMVMAIGNTLDADDKSSLIKDEPVC